MLNMYFKWNQLNIMSKFKLNSNNEIKKRNTNIVYDNKINAC